MQFEWVGVYLEDEHFGIKTIFLSEDVYLGFKVNVEIWCVHD